MFYQVENPEAQPRDFIPDKTRATSVLNSLKDLLIFNRRFDQSRWKKHESLVHLGLETIKVNYNA